MGDNELHVIFFTSIHGRRTKSAQLFLKIIEIYRHDLGISDLLSVQRAANISILGKTNSARKVA